MFKSQSANRRELLSKNFPIESQTSDADKIFLLKTIEIIKRHKDRYSYLEIGSFLGGSLTPFLMDKHCDNVFSVDERGRAQPDERGVKYDYAGISHQTMIQNLVSKGIDTGKLDTFDGSIDAVGFTPEKFDIAFIDGEHTEIACFRDFLWTEPFMKKDAIILFHDSSLVYRAISHAVLYMKRSGNDFSFFKNADSEISGIFMGRYAHINLEKDLGKQVNWQSFCELAEKAVLQSVIRNRVNFNFDISDMKTLPAY